MTAYILKTILCSALLLLFYFLFLEREKMHRFNRFYLLFGIALSFIIPLISITTTVSQNLLPLEQLINVPEDNLQEAITQKTIPAAGRQSFLPIFLWVIYLSGSIFLLSRFLKNIFRIYYKVKNNTVIPYHNSKLVLTADKIIPHSFLQYVFIDKDGFERSAIEKEVLSHELTHVRQRHSLDILFLELLLVVCWFNPFLYLYRKVVQLNHEFLADDAVIETFNNTKAYQYLLLEKSNQAGCLPLTSRLNYLLTKKRLVMMTRTTSSRVSIVKQLALLPTIILAIFLFSTRTIAQEPAKAAPQSRMEVSSTVEGASQELMNEYAAILAKHKPGPNEVWGKTFGYYKDLTDAEKNRLEVIFLQMNKTQQAQQEVFFMPPIPPFGKAPPTSTQLQSWENAKKYGVWIDGKRISNTMLSNYSTRDFSHAFVSPLSKNAINYGKHYYQVDLMTNAYYKDYFEKTKANKKNTMAMRRFKNKEV